VAVDAPIERRPGLRGALVYATKRFLRKLMSWYVGPFAVDQRNFNHTVLRLVDELDERLDAARTAADARADALAEELGARVGDLERRGESGEAEARDRERRAAELEDRLLRLERARRAPAPAVEGPAPQQGGPALDYFVFEARMRGPTAEIRERQRPYVEDFRQAGPVLDVGCGRGEFLKLLRDAGIEARGVDIDSAMVEFAAGEGLDVVHGDALTHLQGLDDGELGGIFSAQVVEHLPPGALVRLLELAMRKLRPGGLFVAETINPLSPMSLRNYFSDLSHAQPLVPETFAILARQAGLRVDEIRYLHEPEERLQPVETGGEALARNIGLLNEQVFAALDYALVASRP
jgi:O-antigen chain-terminating methyltransferase